MPTDPYVPEKLEDEPRQLPNLAPGVVIPPARSWKADRPGDLVAGQPTGTLLGRPGPNVGYALTLVNRWRDRFRLAPLEHSDDAAAVIAEVAMKRAALFGRAPVATDVEVAMDLLGYADDLPPDVAQHRAHAVHGAGHNYARRRALVDRIPDDVLRLAPTQLASRVGEIRDQLLRDEEREGA
ncbi:MAG: hypothetical protein JOZ99_16255 [Actinobacteria bacterium]|nr:hypothetical protein [Actinomycetota bacterium]